MPLPARGWRTRRAGQQHSQRLRHAIPNVATKQYTLQPKERKPMARVVRVVPQDVQELLDKLRDSRRTGNRIDEAWAIANIGRYHRIKDQPVDAFKHLAEAQAIFQEHEDIEGMAWVRREQAKVLMTAAEYDQAEQLLLLALTLHERLNSLHEQAFDLIELGNIARFRKQFDKAIACLTRALALARKANDPLMVAYALHDIGILEHWRGNPAQALPILEVALHQYWQTGEASGVAAALADLGAVAIDLKEYEQAEDYLSRAILAFEAEKEGRAVALCYLNFAQLHQARGDTDAARAATQKGDAMFKAIGAPLPPFGVSLKQELGLV
jgi:tetratricopeptide (TPR) repeat protein